MTDWLTEYTETDDLNEKYGLLREEMTRLRGQRDDIEFFDEDAVGSDVRRLNETVDGDLVVFLANDFGRPRAYRPSGVEREAQDEIRRALLANKYDDTNEDLNEIRRELLTHTPQSTKSSSQCPPRTESGTTSPKVRTRRRTSSRSARWSASSTTRRTVSRATVSRARTDARHCLSGYAYRPSSSRICSATRTAATFSSTSWTRTMSAPRSVASAVAAVVA